MVTDFPEQRSVQLLFDHCICIPTLNLMAVMMFELFTIMSKKCSRYTPGPPRFQTANKETLINLVIGIEVY